MKDIDCSTAERWIVLDLDLGLDKEGKALLRNHVAACENCSRMHDEISVLLSRFSSDVPEDPGEEFWARYHSSLDALLQEKGPPKSWALWWKPATALATVVALLLIFIVAEFRPGKMEQPLDLAISSPLLVAELKALYGPVAEEDQDPVISLEQGRFLIGSSASIAEDAWFQWFEVEDEPNPIFL